MNSWKFLEALKDLQHQNSVGVRFADAKGKLNRVSYAELIERSRSFSAGLLKRGTRQGEPVILVMTNPEPAIIAILGCMIAGCPPTPVYPPVNMQAVLNFLKFVKYVAEKSGAGSIVAEGPPYTFLGNLPHETTTVRRVERYEAMFEDPHGVRIPDETENPVSFLQFTSGSTSDPKGVQVTYEGLSANLQMIRDAAQIDKHSCVVTWLPVYHDMGLIGTVLNAITLPCELIVLPPLLFLKRPRLWLECISEYRGTHTAAPNFAYAICVRRVSDVNGLDLSSMTTFICGAEPVLPATMENFVSHYGPAKLRAGAMVPAYGLAEATLAVTFTPHMRGLKTDIVDYDSLAAGYAASSENVEGRSVHVASCGVPMKGLSVRIVSESGGVLSERAVGEIQILGPTVTPGYIGDPVATRANRSEDGWLRTGDLGYMVEGELYVCGRIKDTIIIRGKNFHAHDLESKAAEVPGVRAGNVVAFGIPGDNGERMVVVAETRNEGNYGELSKAVRSHIAGSFGIAPDEVEIVPAGTIPKTSSGKLKRSETRRLFLARTLVTGKPGKMAAIRAAVKSHIGFLKQRKD